jgi:hypothetical protein
MLLLQSNTKTTLSFCVMVGLSFFGIGFTMLHAWDTSMAESYALHAIALSKRKASLFLSYTRFLVLVGLGWYAWHGKGMCYDGLD